MAPVVAFKRKPEEGESEFRILYKKSVVETEQQNLTRLDPRLEEFLHPSDFFYLHNLTNDAREFVAASGIVHGNLTIQVLHTSATITVNELDEPMLLGDIARKLRTLVPKNEKYLHNSPLRTANRCDDDSHCDRNADAHVKATLFGSPSVSLIVKDGALVLGRWQRVALIEFDGPRMREILMQLMGV